MPQEKQISKQKTKFTGYWMFLCNPAMWQIDDFLSTNIEYDTYKITKWQRDHFHPGQLGIIRVGIDKRTKEILSSKPRLKSGIYAIVEILSEPELIESSKDDFTIADDLKETLLRVKIRYLKNLLNAPILIEDLKNDLVLENDLSVLKGEQASSWPLAKESFDRIINLTGDENAIIENIEPELTSTEDQIRLLDLKYKSATPQIKEVISKRIERGTIGQELKKINNYKCKVCEALGIDPIGFSKKDRIPYVETHHVNQVSNLEQGSLGIVNLITLCANHHRQMHYGNVKLLESNKDQFLFEIDSKEVRIDKVKIS